MEETPCPIRFFCPAANPSIDALPRLCPVGSICPYPAFDFPFQCPPGYAKRYFVWCVGFSAISSMRCFRQSFFLTIGCRCGWVFVSNVLITADHTAPCWAWPQRCRVPLARITYLLAPIHPPPVGLVRPARSAAPQRLHPSCVLREALLHLAEPPAKVVQRALTTFCLALIYHLPVSRVHLVRFAGPQRPHPNSVLREALRRWAAPPANAAQRVPTVLHVAPIARPYVSRVRWVCCPHQTTPSACLCARWARFVALRPPCNASRVRQACFVQAPPPQPSPVHKVHSA